MCAVIGAVVDTALTNALLKQNGPGRPQDLKENILNVKVRIYVRIQGVKKKYLLSLWPGDIYHSIVALVDFRSKRTTMLLVCLKT